MTYEDFLSVFRRANLGWNPRDDQIWDAALEEAANLADQQTAKAIRAMQSHGFHVMKRFHRRNAYRYGLRVVED